MLDGSVIGWELLHPVLAEAAGRVVIEELALNRAIEREASRRGISTSEEMVRAEETALLDELGPMSAGESRSEVLDRIRRSRGLGPSRYASLLRRNATLRAMVRDEATPSDLEFELAREITFGEARRLRLFVSSSDGAAGNVRQAVLDASKSARPWVFAEQCLASSHPTALRGGLIERFSANDPAYPDVVRDAALRLDPGSVSEVLATPAGFAVLLIESVEAERTPTPDAMARVDRRVRIRKERLAMERLANDLLSRVNVSPVDPDLARAWRDR